MTDTTGCHDTRSAEYGSLIRIRTMEEYRHFYRQSVEDPDAFWADQARRYLSWDKVWDFVLRYDFDEGKIEWFGGGQLNASFNCLDRHLPDHRDKVAYHWEGDDPSETGRITYGELFRQVNRFAAVLRSRNIARGDRVVLYMPMTIELPVAMLACARIGAVHTVVFTGFGAKALASRIRDCGAKAVITADVGYRAGKTIPLKQNADRALESCPGVETVIVLRRSGAEPGAASPRELQWHEVMADLDLPDFVPPEPMEAEDPLFILYTSGSTGRLKGIVHTHGGYLLYAAMTTRLIFDLKNDETFWCTADMGWNAGHNHGVYGPLLNGLTSVIFEGSPLYPDYGRCWEMVARYKVSKLYTAPTLIRALAVAGESHLKKHDISSLRLLGTGGECLTPDVGKWFSTHAAPHQCPVVDIYWQAETGGPILIPLPGLNPDSPGSCSLPFFGVDPVILDDTGTEARYPGQEGVLCIRRPWPGMARTIYGDHERFADRYFGQIPGMYFTADGAMRDEGGFYRITGRIDGVINVSGRRLSTAEVESALSRHPLVGEAAVVSYPHPVKGQGIYAFVALGMGISPSDEMKRELGEQVRTEIGPFVTLDTVQWIEALPKTRSGKIIRHILENIAAGKADNLGDISAIADPDVIEELIEGHRGLRTP